MSAIISACGKYRYRLEREINGELLDDKAADLAPRVVAFFGINPSVADASIDDHTIRKMIGFATQWGYSKIIVANVFSYRATDVKELKAMIDTTPLRGDAHHTHVRKVIADADLLVPCWGSLNKLPPALRDYPGRLLDRLRWSGKPMAHLGLNADGTPRHPLTLGYDTPLTPWPAQGGRDE